MRARGSGLELQSDNNLFAARRAIGLPEKAVKK